MSTRPTPRPSHMPLAEWGGIVVLTALILAALNVPYWLAYRTPGPLVFTGILFNPLDGNSYLAKMREGWRGEWLFTLPYTAQPGPGVFIFTYYLFLGHLARWTGAGIEATYHLARAFGGVCLLLSAYHFLSRFFDSFRTRLAAWLCFALGSGLGWLLVPFHGFTADLWVAEAIPFLSVFSNAHFTLTWAVMLWIFEWTLPGLADPEPSILRLALTAVAVTLAAQTQPLALLIVGLVLGALTLWHVVSQHAQIFSDLLPLLVVGLFSAPWILYDFWATAAQPALARWNAQNLTPSPPVWDSLISGGVPLLLALPGIALAARRREPRDRIALAWLGLGALSLYAPFSLQRRLSLGIWTPLVLLAASGVRDGIWPRLSVRWRPLLLALIAILVVPSNLLVYAATLGAILKPDPRQRLFLTREEAAAIDWIAANTPAGAIVLAGPETGLFIPARSDARVIYGHPFETVEADARRQAAEDFFSGRATPDKFLAELQVDHIFYGPREQALGPLPPLSKSWQAVFQQGEVTIYGR